MIKKIHNYQKYCRTLMSNAEIGRENGFVFPMIIFLSMLVGGVGAIEWSSLDYIMVVMISAAGMLYGNNMRRQQLLQIPVSDKFAVLNIIVIFPLYWVVVGSILLGVVMALSGGVIFVFGNGGALGDILYLPSMSDISVLAEWGLQMVPHLIIWAIIMLVSFCQGRWKKISILIGTALVLGIGNWCITQRLAHYQYYGNYSYFEATQLLPHGGIIVAVLAVMAVVVWIYTWKKCLALYRGDVKGQKRYKEVEVGKSKSPIKELSGKTGSAILIIVTIVFMGFIAAVMFSGGEKCSIVTENHTDYQDFLVCLEEEGVESDVYFLESNLSIFPESIDHLEVEEYYAAVEGEYGDGWSSLNWKRILVVNYSEDEYEIERDRVSSLSISYKNQSNKVLKDTEHFAHEAYIAIYNDVWSTYEYALFDDDNYQVAYIFLQENSPYDLETNIDVRINGSRKDILPVKLANAEDGGYSIYSFWNKEWSSYETWWPGKE